MGTVHRAWQLDLRLLDSPAAASPSLRWAADCLRVEILLSDENAVRRIDGSEIVAQTSRETLLAFASAGDPAAAGWGSIRVGTAGLHVHGVDTPAQVKTGETYEIRVRIRSTGVRGRLLVQCARDRTQVQERVADLERTLADVVFPSTGERPQESSSVNLRWIEGGALASGDASPLQPGSFEDGSVTTHGTVEGERFFRPEPAIGPEPNGWLPLPSGARRLRVHEAELALLDRAIDRLKMGASSHAPSEMLRTGGESVFREAVRSLNPEDFRGIVRYTRAPKSRRRPAGV